MSLRISSYTLCSAAGNGCQATLRALRERRSGLTRNDFGANPIDTWIGRVARLEDEPLPEVYAQWECRNNRLAWRGLTADNFLAAARAARERYGPQRVAVVVGTS